MLKTELNVTYATVRNIVYALLQFIIDLPPSNDPTNFLRHEESYSVSTTAFALTNIHSESYDTQVYKEETTTKKKSNNNFNRFAIFLHSISC